MPYIAMGSGILTFEQRIEMLTAAAFEIHTYSGNEIIRDEPTLIVCGQYNQVVRVYEKANFEVFAEWAQIIRC